MNGSFDIVIVGGGPAGLTAALYALRADKSVLVLEKNGFGGQIAQSPRVENFPGTPAMSGAEFADRLLEQVTALGGEIDLVEVTGISENGRGKLVHTPEGDYEAGAVILATGAKHRRLGLPREEELVGLGVSYCAVCDGAFYKGARVAVAGGGDAAAQDALLLAGSCSEVYLIHRRGELRAEAANVRRLRERENVHLCLYSRISALVGERELEALELTDTRTGELTRLPVSGLFVAVGFEPENEIFANYAALDSAGWFASDESCEAGTPGVFVAGDCRAKTLRQLTTAVGDGAAAAVAACRWLDAENYA